MTYEKNTLIVHKALGKVVLGVETVLFNLEFFQAGGEEGKERWGRGGAEGEEEGRMEEERPLWVHEKTSDMPLESQGTIVALESSLPC